MRMRFGPPFINIKSQQVVLGFEMACEWDEKKSTATFLKGDEDFSVSAPRDLKHCEGYLMVKALYTVVVMVTLAFRAPAMLARLFRHRSITHRGGFVNLASGRLAPLTVGLVDKCRSTATN
jgi:hypothetical protein